MPDEGQVRRRCGREATAAAILEAAQGLSSARGYHGVAVRYIAARAGVTRALVHHQYVGSTADVFRAVLARREGFMMPAAPDDPDLLETASLMLARALGEAGQAHVRPIVRSALNGLDCERSVGQFAATERLIELAERTSASPPSAERMETDVDPRLVIGCFVGTRLGWVAAASWIQPAVRLQHMDDAELRGGVEREVLGLPSMRARSQAQAAASDSRYGAPVGPLTAVTRAPSPVCAARFVQAVMPGPCGPGSRPISRLRQARAAP